MKKQSTTIASIVILIIIAIFALFRSSQSFWGPSKDAPSAANFYLLTYWSYYYLLTILF
nr:hypothetical protein [Limosilactobacillus reuteri]